MCVGHLNNTVIYLALYVDDDLVLSPSINAIEDLLTNLKTCFKITMDNAEEFVGVQIVREKDKIKINQAPYIKRLLERFNMNNAKPVKTPSEPGVYLQTSDSDIKTKYPYREAVGSLIFLSTVSRPDICFAVNQVSRFINNPNEKHWQAVKRILRYLKGTIDFVITYEKTNSVFKLVGYTDSDYAGCIETRKSTSGYIFMLGNAPITWSSQRQSVVALSTTEAEYIALALGAKEAMWLKSLLHELGFDQRPVELNVDNQSAIKLAKNPEFHKRTKHIDIKFHFVRDMCSEGDIKIVYVDSKNQIADMLTKSLTSVILSRLLSLIK